MKKKRRRKEEKNFFGPVKVPRESNSKFHHNRRDLLKNIHFYLEGHFPVTIFFRRHNLQLAWHTENKIIWYSITMQHYMKGCQNAGCNTEKTERNFP